MTGREPDPVHDLAAAYALGALSTEEARRFEAFLATSPEAQRDVAEFRDVAALLALGEGDTAPSADLRERVLARVSEKKTAPIGGTSPSRRRVPPLYWGALAASLLAAVGLAWSLGTLRKDVTALQQTLASREATLAERQRQLEARQATLDAILKPGVHLYQLTATGDPDPGIQLFWDQQKNTAVLNGFRLKPVPSGKAYQLWFIKDGKPVPSVIFKPEPNGQVSVERITVPGGGPLSAAAVTVEPEGGSTQPTSPIVLLGPLQKS